MKSLRYILIGSLVMLSSSLAWMASGCSSSPVTQPIVTVSIEPQRFLLEKIVGDKVQVRSLLTEGANPETYDPTVTHMFNIGNSIGYLKIGNIGFEAAMADKISEANPTLPVFDTSEGIVPVYGTHSHGDHDHASVDPHTWTSVRNARIIASNMLAAMKEIDSRNSAYYQKNYEQLTHELDSLDSIVTVRLAPCRGTVFMVWHPSLSYFARDYGLVQLIIGNAEHKESSIASLRESVEQARNRGARIFFFQKDYDSRQISAINAELQAQEVDINPLSYNWDEEIIKITDAIVNYSTPDNTNLTVL
ncbi:MAG: zinc ABC transporter substrate-binding protein [Duncaniella sp.]|nr:zinc ABC transporter substrate-binding protein [Duncaniella sp.]